MNKTASRFLAKAEEALRGADLLLANDLEDQAAGRAYYAMFYVAEALLCEKGLRFRKHGGVHAAFGLHFVRSGEMDARFHRWLLDGFRLRLVGDYGLGDTVPAEGAEELISHAREFLEAARGWLERK